MRAYGFCLLVGSVLLPTLTALAQGERREAPELIPARLGTEEFSQYQEYRLALEEARDEAFSSQESIASQPGWFLKPSSISNKESKAKSDKRDPTSQVSTPASVGRSVLDVLTASESIDPGFAQEIERFVSTNGVNAESFLTGSVQGSDPVLDGLRPNAAYPVRLELAKVLLKHRSILKGQSAGKVFFDSIPETPFTDPDPQVGRMIVGTGDEKKEMFVELANSAYEAETLFYVGLAEALIDEGEATEDLELLDWGFKIAERYLTRLEQRRAEQSMSLNTLAQTMIYERRALLARLGESDRYERLLRLADRNQSMSPGRIENVLEANRSDATTRIGSVHGSEPFDWLGAYELSEILTPKSEPLILFERDLQMIAEILTRAITSDQKEKFKGKVRLPPKFYVVQELGKAFFDHLLREKPNGIKQWGLRLALVELALTDSNNESINGVRVYTLAELTQLIENPAKDATERLEAIGHAENILSSDRSTDSTANFSTHYSPVLTTAELAHFDLLTSFDQLEVQAEEETASLWIDLEDTEDRTIERAVLESYFRWSAEQPEFAPSLAVAFRLRTITAPSLEGAFLAFEPFEEWFSRFEQNQESRTDLELESASLSVNRLASLVLPNEDQREDLTEFEQNLRSFEQSAKLWWPRRD